MFCSSLWPQRKETALTREGGTLGWEGCRKWIGGLKRKSREESFKSQNFHSCYFHISATMRNVHLPQIEAGSSSGKRSHLRNRMMQEMDRERALKV